MDFPCYFIMPLSVLARSQVRTDANDVCDTFKISAAKSVKWSFTGPANAILH